MRILALAATAALLLPTTEAWGDGVAAVCDTATSTYSTIRNALCFFPTDPQSCDDYVNTAIGSADECCFLDDTSSSIDNDLTTDCFCGALNSVSPSAGDVCGFGST